MFQQPHPPALRVSTSFQEMEDASPDGYRFQMQTPVGPMQPRRESFAPVPSGESSLSGAATCDRALLGLGGDLDSPNVRPGVLRMPSCPQKEAVKVYKRSTAQPPVAPPVVSDDGADDVLCPPRALDMTCSDADPLNGLSLSPMNMSHSPSGPRAPGKPNRGSRLVPEDPRRGKRPRFDQMMADQALDVPMVQPSFSRADSMGGMMPPPSFSRSDSMSAPIAIPYALARASNSGSGSSYGDGPVMLRHQNSMCETKMLFAQENLRGSFSAPPGSEMEFMYEDHFEWLEKLGSGSFADVYMVRNKRTNDFHAIKRSKAELRNRPERAEYLREVQLANDMPAHINVVEYLRAWQDHKFFYVQMELCEGGSLRQVMTKEREQLRALEVEPKVWEMVRHIARGLGHIHSYNVLHCDIKPDNVLLSKDGVFKIGDLGQAMTIQSWNDQEGDSRYLCRDLLQSQPSTAADIFSFGIMLYEIKTGEDLPTDGDQWEFLRDGCVPAPPGCGPELAALIHRAMSPRPEERPHADGNDGILQACCRAAAAAAVAAIAARSAAPAPPAPAPAGIPPAQVFALQRSG